MSKSFVAVVVNRLAQCDRPEMDGEHCMLLDQQDISDVLMQELTTLGIDGAAEPVAVVGDGGSVSWRSETILPVGASLFAAAPATWTQTEHVAAKIAVASRIERAMAQLPHGYSLSVCAARGSIRAELHTPEGSIIASDGEREMGIAEKVSWLIEWALDDNAPASS
jgi:hypothetical protein